MNRGAIEFQHRAGRRRRWSPSPSGSGRRSDLFRIRQGGVIKQRCPPRDGDCIPQIHCTRVIDVGWVKERQRRRPTKQSTFDEPITKDQVGLHGCAARPTLRRGSVESVNNTSDVPRGAYDAGKPVSWPGSPVRLRKVCRNRASSPSLRFEARGPVAIPTDGLPRQRPACRRESFVLQDRSCRP